MTLLTMACGNHPRECKLKLKELNRTSDKCNALKAQLRYRKNALKQTDLDKKLYSFSKIGSNGKRHPLTHMELMSNLLKVLTSVSIDHLQIMYENINHIDRFLFIFDL